MKMAWIENGTIRDICIGDPHDLYHPDIAAKYDTDVPDSADNGDSWNGTTLTKQTNQPQAPSEVPPVITKTHFLLTFSSNERVKARLLRETDPVLDDFWMVLDTTDRVNLALPSVQIGVDYTLQAINASGLTLDVVTRKAEILAGKMQ